MWLRVRATKLHAQHGRAPPSLVTRVQRRGTCTQEQHCLARRQKQRISAAAGEEIDLPIDLALVGFEAERLATEGLSYSNSGGRVGLDGRNYFQPIRLVLRSRELRCEKAQEE